MARDLAFARGSYKILMEAEDAFMSPESF